MADRWLILASTFSSEPPLSPSPYGQGNDRIRACLSKILLWTMVGIHSLGWVGEPRDPRTTTTVVSTVAGKPRLYTSVCVGPKKETWSKPRSSDPDPRRHQEPNSERGSDRLGGRSSDLVLAPVLFPRTR